MTDLNLQADIAARYQPFLEFVLAQQQKKIHSVYMVGSALTADYDPKSSDINSVIVLHKMDFKFLELLAPVGKKFGKKQVAAPLIMTPAYIEDSQDVFPIEFLNIQLNHHTVWGEDIFKALKIRKSDLRHQCERIESQTYRPQAGLSFRRRRSKGPGQWICSVFCRLHAAFQGDH